MSELRASLIVPARNEDALIRIFLERLEESVSLSVEVLIVVDSESDSKSDSDILYRFRICCFSCSVITNFFIILFF